MDGATLLSCLMIIFVVFIIIYFVNIEIWHSNTSFIQKIIAIKEKDKRHNTNIRFNAKSQGIGFFTPFGSEKKAVEYLENEYKRQQLLNGINTIGFQNELQMRSKINDLLIQQEQLRGAKLTNSEKEALIQELLYKLKF